MSHEESVIFKTSDVSFYDAKHTVGFIYFLCNMECNVRRDIQILK